MSVNLSEYTEALRSKKITLRDALAPYLENAKQKNSSLNMYLELFSDIDEQIKSVEDRLAKGEICPLPAFLLQ